MRGSDDEKMMGNQKRLGGSECKLFENKPEFIWLSLIKQTLLFLFFFHKITIFWNY